MAEWNRERAVQSNICGEFIAYGYPDVMISLFTAPLPIVTYVAAIPSGSDLIFYAHYLSREIRALDNTRERC